MNLGLESGFFLPFLPLFYQNVTINLLSGSFLLFCYNTFRQVFSIDDVLVFNIPIERTAEFDAKQAFREVTKRVLAAACGQYSAVSFKNLERHQL